MEDKDLMSVRDLYKKIKTVLSQENTERLFQITDQQLLYLHEQIDEQYEAILTDNLDTDFIFKSATSDRREKSQNKEASMLGLNIAESATLFDST